MSGTYRDPPSRCSSCGVDRPAALLVLGDTGPVCSICEASAREAQRVETERFSGQRRNLLITGVIVALGFAAVFLLIAFLS